MILDALAAAGGVEYLTEQAERNPAAFLTLVGKLLPLSMQHGGKDGAPIKHRIDAPVKETREEWLARHGMDAPAGTATAPLARRT